MEPHLESDSPVTHGNTLVIIPSTIHVSPPHAKGSHMSECVKEQINKRLDKNRFLLKSVCLAVGWVLGGACIKKGVCAHVCVHKYTCVCLCMCAYESCTHALP